MYLSRKVYAGLLLTAMISCVSKTPGEKDRIVKDRLFQATYDSGVGGCSLAFYKDGTCIWMPGIASDDQEGRYHLEGNLITLEGITLKNCLKSNKLLITTFNPNQKTSGDSILVQVNAELKPVDSMYIFTFVH
jgi:hypothetical protein